MSRSSSVGLFVVLLCAVPSGAIASNEDGPVPFDSDRWTFDGGEHRLEEHLGRTALFLEGSKAILKGLDLTSGVIEFDIAFNADRGFSGAMFHFRDGGNFEQFYLRPHQSGNPDASQYQPTFSGIPGRNASISIAPVSSRRWTISQNVAKSSSFRGGLEGSRPASRNGVANSRSRSSL